MAINVSKAVIHVLNQESSEPLLNEFELEINDDIYNFLEKHISKSLSDDDARKARFKEGLNLVKEVSFRTFVEPDYFLEGSKEIARQLFKAMKTNSSISSTDLIVCLYENEEEHSIAVLKMDYSTSFIHDIELIDEKFKISIKKQEISLPGIGQKIQKCAFIRENESPNEHDMILLDNQINSKNVEEPIAHFFIQTFLGAELISDNKTCTKLFKKETENWIREKSKEGESSVEEIRSFVNDTIRNEEEVDLAAFSEKVFGNNLDLRDDYVNSMKEKGLNEEKFSVDKEWVDRKLRKIRLKTETNIEVIMDYEDFTNREKFEIIMNQDGSKTLAVKSVRSIMEN